MPVSTELIKVLMFRTTVDWVLASSCNISELTSDQWLFDTESGASFCSLNVYCLYSLLYSIYVKL